MHVYHLVLHDGRQPREAHGARSWHWGRDSDAAYAGPAPYYGPARCVGVERCVERLNVVPSNVFGTLPLSLLFSGKGLVHKLSFHFLLFSLQDIYSLYLIVSLNIRDRR